MQASEDFKTFYAGCRDGSVYKIDETTGKIHLLIKENNPINKVNNKKTTRTRKQQEQSNKKKNNKILVTPDGFVWVGTSLSSIQKWVPFSFISIFFFF